MRKAHQPFCTMKNTPDRQNLPVKLPIKIKSWTELCLHMLFLHRCKSCRSNFYSLSYLMKCKIYAEDLHLQFCRQSLLIHRETSSSKYEMQPNWSFLTLSASRKTQKPYLKLRNQPGSIYSNNYNTVPFPESSYLFQQLCQGGFLAIKGTWVVAAHISEWLGRCRCGHRQYKLTSHDSCVLGVGNMNLEHFIHRRNLSWHLWPFICLTELPSPSELSSAAVAAQGRESKNDELWEYQVYT